MSPKVIQAQKKVHKTAKNKGGRPPAAKAIMRQAEVEKYMVAGLTATKMASLKHPDTGKRILASYRTIIKDINIIKSRWLESESEWFTRTKVARIEASTRLRAQMVRQNLIISGIKSGTYDTKDMLRSLLYAEAQLTTIVTRIYEIESDFDPEQYVDKRIQAKINVKIEDAEAETGR